MLVSTIISMGLFSLVASLSLGPVNLVGVSSGARYGLAVGLRFITGATLGFIALFLLIGFGLQQLMMLLSDVMVYLKWAGIGFLLYLSYQLLRDSGELSDQQAAAVPTPWLGVLMQWLNPKAWLASVSGIAAYTEPSAPAGIWLFAGLYLVICWGSLASWVVLGVWMSEKLNSPSRIRILNRVLALGLLVSCVAIAY